jgi:hypothetical protein
MPNNFRNDLCVIIFHLLDFRFLIQEYTFTIVTNSEVFSTTCDTYCLCTYSATTFRIHACNLHHAVPFLLRSFILHTHNIHQAMTRFCRKRLVKSSVQLAVALTYNLVTSPTQGMPAKELRFGNGLYFFFVTKPLILCYLNNVIQIKIIFSWASRVPQLMVLGDRCF